MCIYSFKITSASTKMLKESTANIPMSFYVECKNDETEQQCFDKISRKFRQKYGVVIESADVEQISEGMWDRLKAKTAGAIGAAKQAGKNAVAGAKNFAKTTGDVIKGGKAMANAKSGETVSVKASDKEEYGNIEDANNKAKVLSILKSKLAKLNKFISDVDTDIEKLGIKLPEEKKYGKNNDMSIARRWSNLKSMGKTFAKDVETEIASSENSKKKEQPAKEQPAEEKTEQPQEQNNTKPVKTADKIAQNGPIPNPIKKNPAKKKVKTSSTAPSKEVDNARKQAADEYTNGNPENEETPAKKKSSRKDPFAPNPFF